ncbi:MAG: RDD family protein [Cytophagales bacterium]|nr:RDD family protein [Cytophagales bacterium]
MESQQYAPFWSRLLAHNIDLVLFLPIGYGISELVISDFSLYGILGGIYVLYNTILETTSWQGSLGKRLLSIKVTPDQGVKGSLWRSLLRNSLKFVSLVLLFGGFLMIRFNMKRQGLHDWLSGSAVISV